MNSNTCRVVEAVMWFIITGISSALSPFLFQQDGIPESLRIKGEFLFPLFFFFPSYDILEVHPVG